MRSTRRSLSFALFAGSLAVIACGNGDDDDDTGATAQMDAAVIAMPGGGGTPNGPGSATPDAGSTSPAANPVGQFDAAIIDNVIGGFVDSGVINPGGTPAGAINTNVVCQMYPQVCVDGSISLGGFGGDGGTRRDGGLGRSDGGFSIPGDGGAIGGLGSLCAMNPQICMMFGGGAGTAP